MIEINDGQYDTCFLKSYLVSYSFMVFNLLTTIFLYFGCNTRIYKLQEQVDSFINTNLIEYSSESETEEEESETEEEESETETEPDIDKETVFNHLNDSELRVIGKGVKKIIHRCYSDTSEYFRPKPIVNSSSNRVVETSNYKFNNY